MAPAGVRGYRVGPQDGQSLLMRWFPAVKLRQVPMFSLEPLEWLAVLVRGTYAVAYMNQRCEPINRLAAPGAQSRSLRRTHG